MYMVGNHPTKVNLRGGLVGLNGRQLPESRSAILIGHKNKRLVALAGPTGAYIESRKRHFSK